MDKINQSTGLRYMLVISTAVCILTNKFSHGCSISPVISNNNKFPSETFEQYKSMGVHYIKLYLFLQTTTGVNKLSFKGNDTFDPSLWVWATNEGKYLLRLPIDYTMLSIGLLSVHEASMDVTFTESEEDCLQQLSEPEMWNTLSSFLVQSVLSLNLSEISSGNQLICRSAYTFHHFLYSESDEAEGVGFKCCSENTNSDTSSSFTCNTSYSDGWKLVWIGPLVILVWLYALIGLAIYRSIGVHTEETSGFLIFEKFINDLKEDIITTIEKKGSEVTLARKPSELLSFHETVYVADAIGISKQKQLLASRATRILGVILAILLFYTYFGLSIYYYWIREELIVQCKDSKELYINVFGHLGWLFGKSKLSLKYYAIFEAIITAIVPVLVSFNYSSVHIYRNFKTLKLSKKLLKGHKNKQPQHQEKEDFMKQQGICACYTRCTNSIPGRVIQVISFIILILYIVCIGSVYVVFSAYFILLGLFISADVLGTWMLPVMIFVYYITIAFQPLVEYYKIIKQNLFTLLREHRNDLIIQQERDMLIPRSLLDEFYHPRSKERVVATIQNIIFAMAVLILLFLALLTIQYPAMNLDSSGTSILGVNFVILLPFLFKALAANKLSDHDLNILIFDLTLYIKEWETDRSKKATPRIKTKNKIGHSSKSQPPKSLSMTTAKSSENLASTNNNSGSGIELKVLNREGQGESPSSTLNLPHKPLLDPIIKA